MRGGGGVGRGWAESRPRPGRAPRGCPAAVQGPAPMQSRTSFALPAGAPARGRSSGPRPRSTARAAAVARRAETTKDGPWVTPARGSGRGPPHTEATEHRGRAGRAPAGGAGRGRALLARRAQTGRRRNTGARAHGHMESRWSRPPLRKHNGKHTHRPGALHAKRSSLRFSGASACCGWRQDEGAMVLGRGA